MIERQVVVPAGPDELWYALTDPDEAGDWLGGDLDWELEVGAPLRFAPDDGPSHEGRIEEVEPGRKLRFSWWPVDGEPSEVTYVLEPLEDGSTALTVEEMPLVWTSRDTGMLNAWASASCLAAA